MQSNSNEKKNVFVEMEEEVLSFWDKNKIFEKSVNKDAPHGDYVFYDGPPFATGTPHYGHLVASLMKDSVPRYWTMNGYRVERRWGWDCHGLPIENIVEKELNTSSKKEIEENVGVEKFNALCRSKVMEYADVWKKTITRLGRWADMDNAYRTMDLPYMESVWWAFKQLWDKGLVYKDYRSMHICPRCETTLSQSEVTEGYKDVKDWSVTAKFELVDEPNTFVLAWTTTPWTLPGNVALAVGNDISYCKLKITNDELQINDIYILAKERIADVLKNFEYKILEEFKGSELVGKKYKPLFDNYANDEKLANRDNGWKIYHADFVTTTDGTGVVHIAPAFGEDDMNLGRKENLPFVQHVGMDGMFRKEMGELAGLHVKPKDDVQATDIIIIKNLAAKNLLFSKEKYEHSYPHCWRCETPLINYATSSWFINITKMKGDLLKNAEPINWSPAHLKDGRFGQWLEGARDWSISRQRFWASCIPIWESENGDERIVVGSIEELEKLSGQKISDLHKDFLDKITFNSPTSGKLLKRIGDVLDCWFESGSMPYAQMHYPFENKEKFENNFPAEFIAEGVDQTRAWFYYMHAIATGVKNIRAFNNVIVNGIVLAEDGKKMSKRLKNYPDPDLVLEKHGADALRYYLLTSPVMMAENLNFSEKGVMENLRKINMLLWNVYKFYEMYAPVCHSDPESSGEESLKGGDFDQVKGSLANARDDKKNNILDQWIIARLNQLISEVTEGMNNYDLPRATRPIALFIDDLSTWYLRRSRDRFKDEGDDKDAALATTKYVLIELAKVMAPFTPFIAEQLWQKVSGNNFTNPEKSVHLEKWPENKFDSKRDGSLLYVMQTVRHIVELGLAERDKAEIKVRQPLSELMVDGVKLEKEFENLIKDELNVKLIIFNDEVPITPFTVKLNTAMTPELIAEGAKRELVRFINAERKNAGLSIADRIKLLYSTPSENLKNVFTVFGDDLKKDVLANEISEGSIEGGKEFDVNGEKIILKIEKI